MNLPKRGEVWLVILDPTIGSEIKKTRPAMIVSPDVMNTALSTVLVAPMTTTQKKWPCRIDIQFEGTDGQIALDQLRAVDRQRLARRLGTISYDTLDDTLDCLRAMFSD
jgi:mRNA interferase MazF